MQSSVELSFCMLNQVHVQVTDIRMQQLCILFKFVAAKPGDCIQALALHKYYLAGPHTYLPHLCVVSQPERGFVFSLHALLS